MEVSVIRACDGGLHPSYEGVVRGPGRRMRDRRIIIVDRRKGEELGVFWRGKSESGGSERGGREFLCESSFSHTNGIFCHRFLS